MVELEHARNILSELGLNTASELLDAKLEDSLHKEATYLTFLNELLETEIQEKRRRSEETRLKLSRLPHRKTLEEFEFSFQPSIDTKQIKELSTLAFVARAENVIFFRASRCRQDSSCGRSCDASAKIGNDCILCRPGTSHSRLKKGSRTR